MPFLITKNPIKFPDLSRAQRTLSKSLDEFNFECIGTTQTDDEQVIVNSLKQFSRLIASIEDERDNMVTNFETMKKVFSLSKDRQNKERRRLLTVFDLFFI